MITALCHLPAELFIRHSFRTIKVLTAALSVHRMKLLKAVIAAGVLTSVYAVDVDVAVGPFGSIQGAENRFMSRLRRDAVGSRKPAAAARVSHPTGLLVWGESLFATEFRRDRVLVASTARAAQREGSKKFAKGWTVFADRGRHCATTGGKVRCARLDGACRCGDQREKWEP